jgi:uroporphyrinogen decarboxylase
LEKITQATIAYLKNQVAAGADVLQIFDSWAGVLSPADFETFSLKYMRQIVQALQGIAPVTLFAKDAAHSLKAISQTGCAATGLGWTVSPKEARELLGQNVVIQGNLDPCALYAPVEHIRHLTEQMLGGFGGACIANLGHGVYPDTPLEGVKAFIETVKGYRYP